jgi:hypothetical protein
MYDTFAECKAYFSQRYQYLSTNKTLYLTDQEIARIINEAIMEYVHILSHRLFNKNGDYYYNLERLSEVDNLLVHTDIAYANGKFSLVELQPIVYSYISFALRAIDKCNVSISLGCTLLSSDDYAKQSINPLWTIASRSTPFVCISDGELRVQCVGLSPISITVTYLHQPSVFTIGNQVWTNTDYRIKDMKSVIDIAVGNSMLNTGDERWQASQTNRKINPI